MGITAERAASRWNVRRRGPKCLCIGESPHRRAFAAIDRAEFCSEILPYSVSSTSPDLESLSMVETHRLVDTEEGPRSDTSLESLARLSLVFAAKGTVTAGNSA